MDASDAEDKDGVFERNAELVIESDIPLELL